LAGTGPVPAKYLWYYNRYITEGKVLLLQKTLID